MQTNKKEEKLNTGKIYQEFLDIRLKKSKKTVVQLAKKYKISRQRIYQIVDENDNGVDTKLGKCLASGRLTCIYKHRYQSRFKPLAKIKRTKEGQELLRVMCLDMMLDGFTILSISEFTKLDRKFITNLVK